MCRARVWCQDCSSFLLWTLDWIDWIECGVFLVVTWATPLPNRIVVCLSTRPYVRSLVSTSRLPWANVREGFVRVCLPGSVCLKSKGFVRVCPHGLWHNMWFGWAPCVVSAEVWLEISQRSDSMSALSTFFCRSLFWSTRQSKGNHPDY